MTNKTTKKFSPEEGARAVASGALARHNIDVLPVFSSMLSESFPAL